MLSSLTPSRVSSASVPAAEVAPVPAPSDSSVPGEAASPIVAQPAAEVPIPPFPPAPFSPLAGRTARKGDGVWTPVAGAVPGEPLLFVRTAIHPDAIKTQIHVEVVAVDLTQITVHLVAGTREPLSPTIAESHRPGLIPAEDLADLVVVHNGGFMTRHGGWGMKIGEDLFVPPRQDGCTVAVFGNGSVGVGSWSRFAGSLSAMRAFRQTPPCLIEHGQLNSMLAAEPASKRWGAAENGSLEIRRSALGLTAGGRTLLYGLGEGVTASALARAMAAASAVDAAELDVNWSFTRFFFYAPPTAGALPAVTSTLIPKLKHAAGEYVKKPAERDFFYWKRRR